MKSLILLSNFYQDIDALNSIINPMEFEPNLYGPEIPDFEYNPNELQEAFNHYLNENVEVQLGTFRKSNSIIHFENFYQHSLWKCIVAIEDTTLKTFEQDDVKSFYDVKDLDSFMLENSNDESKWNITSMITLKKNDFIFIRPWIWHSLEQDKLVQVFLLNTELKEIRHDTE